MRAVLRHLGLAFILLLPPLSGRSAAEPRPSIESELLHRRVFLDGVLGWNPAARQFLPVSVTGPTQVTVLHLWSPRCGPCVEELPLLRRLVAAWRTEPAVRFLIVGDHSEDSDGSDLVTFVDSHREQFPSGPVLRLRDSRLRESLATSVQPLTLLLDEKLVIRQVFAGPLKGRNLGSAVTRLLAVVR